MWCEAALRRRALPLPLAVCLAIAPGGVAGRAPALAAPPADEDELFRQVKVDVFDQDWAAVLKGCETILTRFPGGTSEAQASFYRARALTRLPGREADGVRAYREFIAAHPGDKVMVEEAWASIFTAACEPRSPGSSECRAALREGLGSPSRYVSTLAAIRASDAATDEGLRHRALGTLKKAYADQTDSEIRNEILIAILKIDPKEVPAPPPAPAAPRIPPAPKIGGGAAKGATPSLIRMTIYDKKVKKFNLKVNVPVAFGRLLIEALGESQKEEMQKEARQKGIDLDDIFQSIERSGAGKLLEVDDDTCHIEIWLE